MCETKFSKEFPIANTRINSVQAISDSIMNGGYEVAQFPELLKNPRKLVKVLENIVDRVRPLQVRTRGLEMQLKSLKELKELKESDD